MGDLDKRAFANGLLDLFVVGDGKEKGEINPFDLRLLLTHSGLR